MSEVIAWAESQYDQVLIDCPPVLAATDGAIVGRQIDGVVLVVQPEKNHRRLVIRAVEGLRSMQTTIIGVVANKVSIESEQGNYGYGYGYGYGYEYGSEDDADGGGESGADAKADIGTDSGADSGMVSGMVSGADNLDHAADDSNADRADNHGTDKREDCGIERSDVKRIIPRRAA